MIRTCTFVLVLAFTSPSILAGQDSGSALTGRWTVTGIAGAQETTSLSSDEADQLKGRDFVVTSASVHFADETCEKPTFIRTRHSTAVFFRREYKLDPRSMRLPDSVTEIAIQCHAPSPINFVYLRDKRHMVLFWRGFFLNATRRPDKAPATGTPSSLP
ncbi:MAG TPA: hypothetical protein VF800_10760 [Telluria sp.]|jgi:hypothetical protein